MRVLIVLLGIIVGIFALCAGMSLVANMLFSYKVDQEVDAFLEKAHSLGGQPVITEADMVDLPVCVKRWLCASQVIGKRSIETVRLTQEAALRMDDKQPWMSAKAIQYYRVADPGLIWKTEFNMNPLIRIVGRDMYEQGRGHMLIRVLALIPVADAKGKEIDQGTMLRYLGEMAWFPTAALSDYLRWEEIDTNTAKATMTHGGITASGVFRFSDDGKVLSFEAERHMENKGEFSLEDWIVQMKEYKEFNGVVIPNKVDVIWKLDSGDFHWFSCEVTDVEYNF
ncbi:MAG: hypothetical protein PHV61_08630 [Limnochordia bacterium]|nr:hypothetical protein [Limnochordia bacterium]MDD4518698.1 hypothetical protein [Limnochordia bacterium]